MQATNLRELRLIFPFRRISWDADTDTLTTRRGYATVAAEDVAALRTCARNLRTQEPLQTGRGDTTSQLGSGNSARPPDRPPGDHDR